METAFLEKVRKLNWVLMESTTGSLSYNDISRILSETINANLYIMDINGVVLGVSYTNIEDTSAFFDELGVNKIPEEDNRHFIAISETRANLVGTELVPILGENYSMRDKYHMIVPCSCGGQRLGTILAARYTDSFVDEDIALCEIGATVIGLEIQRNIEANRTNERNRILACEMAFDTLSFSERIAISKIFDDFEGEEASIVASKIAEKYGLTNSIIVSALKKFESAGVLEAKSLGMKGTSIRIVNPYIRETIKNAKI